MNTALRIISAAVLALGVHSAWADDAKTANKPTMGHMNQDTMQKGGMQGGQMNGMGMDNEHAQQMREHMDDMHKTQGMGAATKGEVTCDMKSDSRCNAKDIKKDGKATGNPVTGKPATPAKAK